MAAIQREIFTQRKLKDIYQKTCIRLVSLREGIKLIQEAILWRKPFLSIVLYALIHFIFWNIYNLTDNSISLMGRALFWFLLVDGFWVVATRDRSSSNDGVQSFEDVQPTSTWRRQLSRIRRERKHTKFLTFEEVVAKNSIPLEIGEVLVYEVVCFHIAVILMWIDNVQLALRHWNREQPYMLTGFVFSGGLICCLLGYFISEIILIYLAVLLVLICPIVVYYNVVSHVSHMISVHYPILTQKLQYWYNIVKKHFHKLPDEEFHDYQLAQPVVANGNHHQYTPHPPISKDPSISLTPFGHDFNTMDSLVGSSLAPSRHGFQYAPDDSLFLNNTPNQAPPSYRQTPPMSRAHLSRISEASDETNLTDESHDHVSQEFDIVRERSSTLSLGPFGIQENPLQDDDFEDIFGGTSSSPPPSTTTTTTSTSNNTSTTDNEPVSVTSSSSPYFSNTINFPSPLMSTPLESNEDKNDTLRQRHTKDQ